MVHAQTKTNAPMTTRRTIPHARAFARLPSRPLARRARRPPRSLQPPLAAQQLAHGRRLLERRRRDREAAEAWFVAALEAWRVETECERLVLVGHSLGGYLSACYALRHPSRVAGLFLVSAAGVAVPARLAGAAAGDDTHLRTMRGGMVPNDPAQPTPRAIPRFMWGLVSYLWQHDWTPGRLIRNLGPLGESVARGGIRRRASRWVLARPLPEPLLDLVGTYLWHANGAWPGGGEFALRCLLSPGAHAKVPIGTRLVALAAAGRLAAAAPVVLFYGATHDWMNADAGDELAEALSLHGLRSASHRLADSGHHCYLENCDAFNSVMLAELALVAKTAAR